MALIKFFGKRTAYFAKYESGEALFHFSMGMLEDEPDQSLPRPRNTTTSCTDHEPANARGLLHLLDQVSTRPVEFEIDSDTVVYPKWTSSSTQITLRDIHNEPRQALIGFALPRFFSFVIRLAVVKYTLTALRTSSIPMAVHLHTHLTALAGWSPPATSLKLHLAQFLVSDERFSEHLQQATLTLLLSLTLISLETLPFLRCLVGLLVKALRPTFSGFCIWFVVNGWFSDIVRKPEDQSGGRGSVSGHRNAIDKHMSQHQVDEGHALLRILQGGLRIRRTHSADGLFRLVLMWAVKNDNTDLIDHIISVDQPSSTSNVSLEADSLTSEELDLALQVCVEDGNLQTMEHLLVRWAHTIAGADSRLSALPFAMSIQDLDSLVQLRIMEIMLGHGVDPDSTDENSKASLHYCVDRPHLLQLLLDSNASTEVRDRDGKTPLHHAFNWPPQLISAERLVNSGADLESQTNQGRTPLLCAIYESESADTVSWLIGHGVDFNICGTRNPLQTAAYWGQVQIAALLLDAGADPNFSNAADESAPLSQVMDITQSDVKRAMVELLLARGAEPTLQALGAALRGDRELRCGRDTGITRFLINQARQMGTPFPKATLDEAVYQNYTTHNMYVFKEITDAGVDANVPVKDQLSNGTTGPLHLACRERKVSLEDLMFFIDHGADVRLPDSHGNTPLHGASRSGNIDAVIALVSAGASIEVQNSKGQTALHLACESFSQYSTVEGAAVGKLLPSDGQRSMVITEH